MSKLLKKIYFRIIDFISVHTNNDELSVKLKWQVYCMPYPLNIDHPKTYNEKIQWLKLNDHNPLYTTLVDKYAVKNYVSKIIGQQYIIPTIGVWDNVDDITWEKMPKQFVLKCTHDSGGIVICRDKSQLDIANSNKKLNYFLKREYYKRNREWPYKNVPHRIIAEEFMEDTETKELRDYKFFCFNGQPKALFIATDRTNPNTDTKFDFFDMDYNHLDLRNGHPNAVNFPKKPKCFEEMKTLASKLSQGIPHVRVDFYEVDEKVYFGELTFYHWSGFVKFEPSEWDYIFGSWIKLPFEHL